MDESKKKHIPGIPQKSRLYLKSVFYTLTLVYAVVGLIFLFLPVQLVDFINTIYAILLTSDIPGISALGLPSTTPAEAFYVVLTTAMMMMLSFCAFQTARHPEEKLLYQIHLLSKFTSVLGFCYYFIKTNEVGYSVGALTDGAIFIFVFMIYRRLQRHD